MGTVRLLEAADFVVGDMVFERGHGVGAMVRLQKDKLTGDE